MITHSQNGQPLYAPCSMTGNACLFWTMFGLILNLSIYKSLMIKAAYY